MKLHPRLFSCKSGFTLVEVMIAAAILGLTSFGMLSLLRASDQMAMRGRMNGTTAANLTNRASLLEGLSYADFATLTPGTTYYSGTATAGGAAPTNPFPSRFCFSGEDPNVSKYLMYGQPLPGTTALRPLALYRESISITVVAPIITIAYSFQWMDPTTNPSATPSFSTINFTFSKNDPTYN